MSYRNSSIFTFMYNKYSNMVSGGSTSSKSRLYIKQLIPRLQKCLVVFSTAPFWLLLRLSYFKKINLFPFVLFCFLHFFISVYIQISFLLCFVNVKLSFFPLYFLSGLHPEIFPNDKTLKNLSLQTYCLYVTLFKNRH